MIVSIPHTLLGDTILVEPSMSAWSIAHGGEKVNLVIEPKNSPFECLFAGNPHIQRYVDPWDPDEEIVKPDTSAAFSYASNNNLPFAAGYFPQFGLSPRPGIDRLHYKMYGLTERSPRSYVCICPHARSCDSARDPRYMPNIRATPEFWAKIVDYLWSHDHVPIDLGSHSDVAIPKTISQHGHDLRFVAENWLLNAAAVISVETGLLHLTGGLDGVPLVFLSAATPVSFAAPPNSVVFRGKTTNRPDFDADEVIKHLDKII